MWYLPGICHTIFWPLNLKIFIFKLHSFAKRKVLPDETLLLHTYLATLNFCLLVPNTHWSTTTCSVSWFQYDYRPIVILNGIIYIYLNTNVYHRKFYFFSKCWTDVTDSRTSSYSFCVPHRIADLCIYERLRRSCNQKKTFKGEKLR